MRTPCFIALSVPVIVTMSCRVVVAQNVDWNPAAETAVVFNPDFPESETLAKYYAEKRGIEAERMIGIACSKEEAISREAYDVTIASGIRQAMIERGWWKLQTQDVRDASTGKTSKLPIVVKSKIAVLVLMHGVPSKIIRKKEQPKAASEDEASVDSELSCIAFPTQQLAGTTPNPFFNKPTRFNETPDTKGMMLVGRLDAANAGLVRRMIDDAVAVEETGLHGRAVIDLALKHGAYEQGEDWLRRSVQTYRENGIPTYADRYEPLIREGWPLPDTALYFGWYAGEISGALKSETFRFKRGAVACHLHSFSAATIRTTTQAWVGPLIAHGAAATMGNVWEPYLSYTVHFDILNDRLLKGWTLAEAAWCGTPGLSWMNVVIGDPLYRPFARSLMGDAADRDYAIYKGFADKHRDDKDSTEFKQDVLKAGQDRQNPRLIEMLALLASQESKPDQAIELLQHARSLYTEPTDKLRTTLYEVELLCRDHEKKKDKEALTLLQRTAANGEMKSTRDFGLVNALIKELGG
jgi:uncharacterized protein (TIGR03790 family)